MGQVICFADADGVVTSFLGGGQHGEVEVIDTVATVLADEAVGVEILNIELSAVEIVELVVADGLMQFVEICWIYCEVKLVDTITAVHGNQGVGEVVVSSPRVVIEVLSPM
jgi:hypothetical protein